MRQKITFLSRYLLQRLQQVIWVYLVFTFTWLHKCHLPWNIFDNKISSRKGWTACTSWPSCEQVQNKIRAVQWKRSTSLHTEFYKLPNTYSSNVSTSKGIPQAKSKNMILRVMSRRGLAMTTYKPMNMHISYNLCVWGVYCVFVIHLKTNTLYTCTI